MEIGMKQKNDSVIRLEGMRLLIENMGKVDAERFIIRNGHKTESRILKGVLI